MASAAPGIYVDGARELRYMIPGRNPIPPCDGGCTKGWAHVKTQGDETMFWASIKAQPRRTKHRQDHYQMLGDVSAADKLSLTTKSRVSEPIA